jgi:hypothetical protein
MSTFNSGAERVVSLELRGDLFLQYEQGKEPLVPCPVHSRGKSHKTKLIKPDDDNPEPVCCQICGVVFNPIVNANSRR